MKPGEVVVAATAYSGVTYRATTQLRDDGSFTFNVALPVGKRDNLFQRLFGRKS